MNNTLQLVQLTDSFNVNTQSRSQIPGDIGNSLFKSLLEESTENLEEKGRGIGLYGKTAPAKALSKNKNLLNSRLNDKNNTNMQNLLSIPFARLMLPESAIPQVKAFLADQGLSAEKINTIIQSIKNKDGFLEIDKLFAQLSTDFGKNTADSDNPMISSSQIPQVEQLLFKLGLGSGTVKEIIEKSVNQKGDLALSRLSSTLNEHLTSNVPEPTLIAMLKKQGITIQKDSNPLSMNKTDHILKNELKDFVQNPSQDIQKHIKQNIACLLREKGIPPEEVKSFLETLNVETTKSVLNEKVDKTAGFDLLLNQAVLKNQPKWKQQGWYEKIVNILNNEKLLIVKESNRNWFQDQGDLKLNVAELLKNSGTKIKPESIELVNEEKVVNDVKGLTKGLENQGRNQFIKEGTGADFVFQKVEGDAQIKSMNQVNQVNQIKNYYNLPQPLPKIVDRMVFMFRAGEQRGRLSIKPPELGKLDLNLSVKNGHIQVQMNAESPMVKEIIEANMNQLKQQLNDQGLVVDSFEVMIGLDDRQSKENHMWSGNGRSNSSSKRSPMIDDGEITSNDIAINRSPENQYIIDMRV